MPYLIRLTLNCLFLFGIIITTIDIAQADSFELIKEGKVMAGATALWNDGTPQDTKDRLFKLTVLINFSLSGLSGSYPPEGKLEDFKNKIRISVVDSLHRDVYALWIAKTDEGKELRIAGNNIANTERGAYLFLKKYLKLQDKTIKDLEALVDKMAQQKGSLTASEINRVPFKKVSNLTLEQADMDIRSPLK